MPHDDNQSSEATPPLGVESAANHGDGQESAGVKTMEGQAELKSTSPMEGLFAWRPPSSDNESGPITPDSRLLHDALWEHYQPMGHIEVLLLEKIAADLKHYNVLVDVGTSLLFNNSRLGLDWLHRAERIFRIQAALWHQLVQDIRELERVQQQRKAETNERPASRGRTEDNTVTQPDWIAVVPSASALESEYRLQLEIRAARAANVETKPTDGEFGKSNGATAPKPGAGK